MLVVARAKASMNEFQSLLESSHCKVVQQDGIHKLMIKMSIVLLYNSNTTSPVVVSSYGVLSPSMIWYSSEM